MDDLAARIQNGDAEAFEQLVQEYQHKVFSLSAGILSNRDDALDVSQEVFLKIYRSINTFKGDSSLSTWIYRITKNLCIDFLRKRKRLSENELPDIVTDDTAPSPEDAAILLERRELVRACINELPINYKTVLLLREYRQLSYAEIAQVLEISEGTVKSRISRAREHLLKIIHTKKELFTF